MLDDVGQVVLVLRLLGLERIEQRVEPCAIDHHDPGIAQAVALQDLVGVPLLDDRVEPLLGERQAAIAGGIGRTHAEHTDRGAHLVDRREQPVQRPGCDQRRVTIEDQKPALGSEVLARRHQRMPGAERRLLNRHRRRRARALQLRFDLGHVRRQHHHRTLGLERRGGRQDMADHRASGHPVQDFGQARLHPGALAGSENDHGQGDAHGIATHVALTHRCIARLSRVMVDVYLTKLPALLASGGSVSVNAFGCGGVRSRRHAGRHGTRSARSSERHVGRARPAGRRAGRGAADDR